MNAVSSRSVAAAAPGCMRLSRLLEGLAVPPRDLEIAGLTLDSRESRPGSLFLACRGRRTHGLLHAADAVGRGAVAVLWDPDEAPPTEPLPPQVVALAVPGLGARVGELADRYYDAPSAALRVAAVTGTNGKTTCAYLLAQAAGAAGTRCAYLGTIGFGWPGALHDAGLTTPDAVAVHRRLAEARGAGAAAMSMEVSSHALDQQRVAAVRFDTAVFTNLTRDHLDYHGTLEAYAEAKARLFATPGLRHAVLNAADPFGLELARRVEGRAQVTLYSATASPQGLADGDWIFATELRATAAGLALQVASNRGGGTLRSRLVGRFNADNLLAALGVLLGWGVPFVRALALLGECAAPPGRMETFGGGPQPLAIVDYAHSPDALAKALEAARAHTNGRLFCVFGCGGERDPGKRPQMGAIAEAAADVVIVTDDNPRREDARAIVEQILAGLRDPGSAEVIQDRATAIHHALATAERGDVVLIAGKGHEDYQQVGAERRPFSDRAVVLDALGDRA